MDPMRDMREVESMRLKVRADKGFYHAASACITGISYLELSSLAIAPVQAFYHSIIPRRLLIVVNHGESMRAASSFEVSATELRQSAKTRTCG